MSKYGLHKRPSYEQIVNYIQSDPVIARYPNREATILMNSPQLQNLSNEGSIDLQKQSENLSKQKQKEELVRGSMTPGQTFRISTPRAPGDKSSSSGGSMRTALSDEEKSDAESDIVMGLAYTGFQREMQRQQAAGRGSLLLGTIQQSPEAAAAAAAASGSVQYQPFIPGLTKDPTAAAAALVPKKRTEPAPAAASASASASAPNPLNPFVNPNTIPSFSPDMARFIENVMTASRQMPTTPARPPGQDLLITYLPQQRQTPLALPNQPQKRRSEEKQGGHPPKTLLLQAEEEEEEPKLAKGSGDIVKTKGKVQEVHVAAKKLTSHNYNTWEALTPLQLEEQLTKYYGYRRKWDLKNANRHKTKMLEFAEKVVPLRRSKATPQDS